MQFEDDEISGFSNMLNSNLMQVLHEFAIDNVSKDKDYMEYLGNRTEDELFKVLIPYCFAKGDGTLKKVNNFSIQEKLNFFEDNKESIIKENLLFLPLEDVKKLKEIIRQDGYTEIPVDDAEDVLELDLLKDLGFIFIDFNDSIVKIHVPAGVKAILNKLLDDKSIKDENIKINDKINFIKGSLQIYGAISTNKLYEIYKNFFDEDEKDYFKKIQTITMLYPVVAFTIIQEEHRVILHDAQLTKQEAINLEQKTSKNEIKLYSKEEYIKFASPEFIEKTEAYEKYIKDFVDVFYFDEDEEDTSLEILLTAEQLAKTYIIMKKHKQDNIDNQVRRQLKIEITDSMDNYLEDEEVDENIDKIMEDLNNISQEYPYLRDM